VYIGHAALAILAKGTRPKVPIAVLIPVAFAPDWIEWILDWLGYHNRMLSHSLVSVGIGATLAALVYFAKTRVGLDAMAVWLTYLSHWPADFVTGLKPTWPGGPMVGLVLYTRPILEGTIECLLIVICWMVYRRSLPGATRNRARGLLVPVGLIAMQLAFVVKSTPGLFR